MENVKIRILATNGDPKDVIESSVELFKVEIPEDKYVADHLAEAISMSLQMWRISSALRCMVVLLNGVRQITYVR